MPHFKVNEEVLVTNDHEALDYLGSFTASDIAGRRVTVLSKGTFDDHEGYNVCYIDCYGLQYHYFIYTEHLLPAPPSKPTVKDPRWKQAADAWQKKLWQEKNGDE